MKRDLLKSAEPKRHSEHFSPAREILRPPPSGRAALAAWESVPLALVLVAMCGHAWLAVRLLDTSIDFDAQAYFMPFARELLEKGLVFLANPRSVFYAPMAYLWPAMLGANPILIKLANIAVSALVPPLLYLAGRSVGERGGGLVAALAYAFSPLILPFIPRLLTEPLFLFSCALWLWAVCATLASGSRAALWIGAAAAGLGLLTRPLFMYFLPLAAVTCWIWARRRKTFPGLRFRLRRCAALHGLALVPAVLVIAKNAFLFGFPAIAAGAGGALYLGSNPLTHGFEPPLMSLSYDIGTAAQEEHLTTHADVILKGIAWLMLQDYGPAALVQHAWEKFTALLFFRPEEFRAVSIFNLRSLRIVELIFAAWGMFALRPPVRVVLLAIYAYLMAVLVPVLHNQRYSVGALEIWLLLPAGVGLCTWWCSLTYLRSAIVTGGRGWHLGGALALPVIAVFACTIGWWDYRLGSRLMPDLDRSSHVELAAWDGRLAAELKDLESDEEGLRVAGGGALAVFRIPAQPVEGNAVFLWSLDLAATTPPGGVCRRIEFSFAPEGGNFESQRAMPVRMSTDGKMHRYHVSAGEISTLFPIRAGRLAIHPDCSVGTRLKIGRVVLSRSTVGAHYRKLFLERRGG